MDFLVVIEVNSWLQSSVSRILCGVESRAHRHVFAGFGRVVARARVHHAVVCKLSQAVLTLN